MRKRMKAVGVVLGMVVVIGGSVFVFFMWLYGKRGGEGKATNEGLDVGAKDAVDDPLGCLKQRDKWGRPLVSIRSREGNYYCRSLPPPKQMDEIEKEPWWVVWGKKVWVDDWTPYSPFIIIEPRVDFVTTAEVRGKEVASGTT